MFVHNGIERQTVSPAGCEVVDVDIGVSAKSRSKVINHSTQHNLSARNSSIYPVSLTPILPPPLFLTQQFSFGTKAAGHL